MKLSVISLGCDKNTVDTEVMLGSLSEKFHIIDSIDEADIAIVNTCGFIESAKQESINTILDVSKYKENKLKMLIVTGCLSQRYGEELANEMPEIDLLFGVNDYNNIQERIKDFLESNEKKVFLNSEENLLYEGERYIEPGSISANIKISEGCNNKCTYCSIPKIRGPYRSRKIDNILQEAKDLVEKGIMEINLVAQDTTRYGIDIYGEKKLVELIKELSKIDELKWIRLFYAYPEEIEDDLINEFKINDKLVKYIDMPIQHINDDILKKMNRKGKKEDILRTIEKFNTRVPEMTIRTTFIVGFPGETLEQVEELIEFVKMGYIRWMGTFTYSREEDTPAYNMDNQVDEDEKIRRQGLVMKAQMNVTAQSLKKFIGKEIDVLITRRDKEIYYGRTEFMSNDIDGEVIINSQLELDLNKFYRINIIETLDYDLMGVVKNELSK